MIRRLARVALQGVFVRPGRSALTMVSLFVGVLAVVIIQAGFGAVRDAYAAQAVLGYGRPTTLRVGIAAHPQADERSRAMCESLGRILQPVSGGAAIVGEAEVQADGRRLEMLLTDSTLRTVFPYPVRAGRWLSDNREAPPQIVLNEAASDLLGAVPGSTLLVSAREYGQARATAARVAGIVYDSQPMPRSFMALDPTTEWGQATVRENGATAYVYAPGMDEGALRSVLAVEYARSFGFPPAEIQRSDKNDDTGQFLSTITLVFSAVAALSLLVGALGILNIGLATLKERSDELSLRRSFGATRIEVMATIVAEGQIVALTAAALALAAGYVVFPLVLEWMSQGLLISRTGSPVSAALIGVVASCSAAFVGSLAPALRAGRVPIASIMRT